MRERIRKSLVDGGTLDGAPVERKGHGFGDEVDRIVPDGLIHVRVEFILRPRGDRVCEGDELVALLTQWMRL